MKYVTPQNEIPTTLFMQNVQEREFPCHDLTLTSLEVPLDLSSIISEYIKERILFNLTRN